MKPKKIVVIDTNVIFSAAYNIRSNAGRLLLAGLEGKIKLTAPEIAKKELQEILHKKLEYSTKEIKEFIEALPIEWFPESVYDPLLEKAERMIKRPDADFVALAVLLEGILISGDKEILRIKDQKVRISKLSEFIKKL